MYAYRKQFLLKERSETISREVIIDHCHRASSLGEAVPLGTSTKSYSMVFGLVLLVLPILLVEFCLVKVWYSVFIHLHLVPCLWSLLCIT